MTVYTVHAPVDAAPSEAAADRVQLIPEGFSWGAFLVPPLWLLWNRMWLPFLFYGVVLALMQAGALVLPEGLVTVIGLAFSVWFALEANAMRRWVLARRGLPMVAVVESADLETAEHRFFAAWLAAPVRERQPEAAAPEAGAPRSAPAQRPAPAGVIGLFPDRGGR